MEPINNDGAKFDSQRTRGSLSFPVIAMIAALITTLIAPAMLVGARRVEMLSIIQCCFATRLEEIMGMSIFLVLLTVFAVVKGLMGNEKKYACVAPCAALLVLIGLVVASYEHSKIHEHYGAYYVYGVFCVASILLGYVKQMRLQYAVLSVVCGLAAYISFWTLPFLETEWLRLTGDEISEALRKSHDTSVWAVLFIICPWISAIAGALMRSSKGLIAGAVILLLPWLAFFGDAPESWEFSSGMGMYLICAGVMILAAVLPGLKSSVDPDIPMDATDAPRTVMEDKRLFGLSSGTAVIILTAIAWVIARVGTLGIVPQLVSILIYVFMLIYFRKSIRVETMASLSLLALCLIATIVLNSIQNNYIANQEYESLDSLVMPFFGVAIFKVIGLFGVAYKTNDVTRESLYTYLAIPTITLIYDAWRYAHSFGLLEPSVSYMQTMNVISGIMFIAFIVIVVALLCFNRRSFVFQKHQE